MLETVFVGRRHRLWKIIDSGMGFRSGNQGFALVVTLSLMILLTVIAVGLLSLSSISLRQSRTSLDMAQAMANARLSLMLAIGQIQMEMGPDTRISVVADQLAGSSPATSAAAENRRQWTGVYDAWQTPNAGGLDSRPTPSFRQWLVSGSPNDLKSVNLATSSAGAVREMVGKGTLGAAATVGLVSVPVIELKTGSNATSRFAWWVGDQGMKAAVSAARPKPPADLASVRAGLQGAPRNAIQLAKAGTIAPFGSLPDDDFRLPLVNSFKQTSLIASDPQAPLPLFHDLASHSSGLLTNVRSGGFRKDLSMYLEKSTPPTGGFPLGKGALYQVNGTDGMRDGELWTYYNLYKQLKTGNIAFTTGGSGGGSNNPFLQAEGNASAARSDNWFYYKRPAIIGYKAMFSFYITPPTGSPPTRYLALCVDPVVTLWNPYDVPISLAPAYNSVRFEKIPYQINNLRVSTGGATSVIPRVKLGGTGDKSFSESDYNYATLRIGKNESGGAPVVLKPGEVLMYSQGAGTKPVAGVSGNIIIPGKPGYNFGGGIYYPMRDANGAQIKVPATAQLVTVTFDGVTTTNDGVYQGVGGGWPPGGTPISVTHAETYLFDDRPPGETVGIGGVFVDFWRGFPPYTSNKPPGSRFTADQKSRVFKSTSGGTVSLATSGTVNDSKKWFFYFAYDVKTEENSLRAGQFLARFNPSAPLMDFADLSELESDVNPVEVRIEGNTGSSFNLPTGLELDAVGRGYFGGGISAAYGSNFVSTHSVPREPIYSLGVLQHALANGFNREKPDTAEPFYTSFNTNMSIRFPMLPQISHAIGNSIAPSVLSADKTEGMLAGRPMADHSYLANRALWDDWFFSGIAPKAANGVNQRQVAESFLKDASPLPVARYRPDIGSEDSETVLTRLFSGALAKPEAKDLVASLIRVDGMFNVNSTSVEAWKMVLGGLKNHPLVVRDDKGSQSQVANAGATAVSALLAPTDGISNGNSIDVKEVNQWMGHRTLEDDQIDLLARKMVEEVRKRGPFLSLADFINRRPGADKELARAGALQCAIDAAEINKGFGTRKASASGTLPFVEAESGSPAAQGIPGVVKQADILTPIAPVLAARSDTFIVRGYGESLDASGTRVTARAWCEAVVERDRGFVDPSDKPEKSAASLNAVNQRFGRRFLLRSFRWLSPNEV